MEIRTQPQHIGASSDSFRAGTSNGGESADIAWARKVRSGLRLLFWSILVSELIGNSLAFALPFVGGTLDDLRWVALLHALAGLLIILAIFRLTAIPNTTTIGRHSATAVRVLIVLEILRRFMATVVPFSWDPGNATLLNIADALVRTALPIVLLNYVGGLSFRFGRIAMGWSIRIAGLLVSLGAAASYFEHEILEALPSFISFGSWGFVALGVYQLLVGMWALYLLWRVGGHVSAMTSGRCLNCGYSKFGTTSHRCPECGASFVIESADAL